MWRLRWGSQISGSSTEPSLLMIVSVRPGAVRPEPVRSAGPGRCSRRLEVPLPWPGGVGGGGGGRSRGRAWRRTRVLTAVGGAGRGARVTAAFDFPVIVSEYTPVRPIGLTVVDGTDRSSIMTSGATSSGDWGPAGSLRVTSMWNDAASARWTAICLSVLTR